MAQYTILDIPTGQTSLDLDLSYIESQYSGSTSLPANSPSFKIKLADLKTAFSGGTDIISLSNALSTEASTRTSKDNSLSNALSTEASTRTSKDNSLSTAILNVDLSSLSTAISTEASTRTSEDNSLSTAILNIPIYNDSSLSTALSTETSSRISSYENGIIGPAEDGDYTDGIFTDFTTGTTVGTAVDRFNEMFRLLAPTPPTTNWSSAFVVTPVISTAVVSTMRMIGTGTVTANVVTSTLQPAFTISSTVGTGVNARTKDGIFVFTIKDYDGSVKETKTINSSSITDLTGTLRYTIADPYYGVSGQAGFWTGCTEFSGVSFITSVITAGVTPRNVYFEHPTGQGKTGTTFYVDRVAVNTPTIGSLTYTIPSMTRYVSGVIGLPTSSTITNVAFNILDACTYFYAPANQMFQITGGVTTLTADIDAGSLPLTSLSQTGPVTNRTLTITTGNFESLTFSVMPRNRISGNGTATSSGSLVYRMDISDETLRLKNTGAGYNSSVGTAYDVTESAKDLSTTNTRELQLLNSSYRWPQGNYTSFGGVNYSSITTGDNISGTEWRWATFSMGTQSTAGQLWAVTIAGTMGSTVSDTKVYWKIGASGWLDLSTNKSLASPYNDGEACLNPAGSTANLRNVDMGLIARNGVVYIRIGIKAANTTYSFSRPTVSPTIA